MQGAGPHTQNPLPQAPPGCASEGRRGEAINPQKENSQHLVGKTSPCRCFKTLVLTLPPEGLHGHVHYVQCL